jgi:hypothetical protein
MNISVKLVAIVLKFLIKWQILAQPRDLIAEKTRVIWSGKFREFLVR